MKKTSYAIIAGVLVFCAIGLGLVAYMSANARPYDPNDPVIQRFFEGEGVTEVVLPDSVAVDSIL